MRFLRPTEGVSRRLRYSECTGNDERSMLCLDSPEIRCSARSSKAFTTEDTEKLWGNRRIINVDRVGALP